MLEDILCGLGFIVFFGGIIFLMIGLPEILKYRERMAKIRQGIDPDNYPDMYEEEED